MIVAVTGASSGIGEAMALAFAGPGSTIALLARRRDRLDHVAARIASAGGRSRVYPVDVADRGALEAALSDLEAIDGPPDVLVNNAGIPAGGSLMELGHETIEHVTRVNMMAAFVACRAVLPSMLARGSGTIVNVASIAGRVGVPGAEIYGASKFALAGFSEALRLELKPRGLNVLLVNPGPIRTESWPHRGVPRPFVVEPRVVGDAIVRAVARGRAEIFVPRYYRAVAVVGALAPGLVRSIAARRTRRKADR